MKIKTVTIENFRGYKNSTKIDFNDLTVLIGKNDSGKSTILEALDIFFNDKSGAVRIEKNDVNVKGKSEGNESVTISVEFCDLPAELVLDTQGRTNLKDEYLLNESGYLEVVKTYSGATMKMETYIKAKHPNNSACSNLHSKNNAALKRLYTSLESPIAANQTINAELRKAIWHEYEDDLELQQTDIKVLGKDDAHSIWESLSKFIPIYNLFQSDRKNSDGDDEVQNPMKLAVNEIIKDSSIQSRLDEVAKEVNEKLAEVANATLGKLQEMDPDVASQLIPQIPLTKDLKWNDVFKNVKIASDENIPINKRGSGVKRLVLLNFFRAEAERKLRESNHANVIYAIEEPETSQHGNYQEKLIEAFEELSQASNTQVIMTTHSALIVKEVEFDNIRLVDSSDEEIEIKTIEPRQLPYVSHNEVNHLAFGDISDDYHNELYGFIARDPELMTQYKQSISQTNKTYYNPNWRNGQKDICISEYIRHRYHHPDNEQNEDYTKEELSNSISAMRQFIENNGSSFSC